MDADGLHPDESKLEAIRNAPVPENVHQLRSFIGLITYYSKFLPNLASRLAPLHALLQHHQQWKWGAVENKAFNDAKTALQSSTLLVHYDPSRSLLLATDASPYGLGAVLSHVTDSGVDQPITFASRSLSPAEKNYSQLEKEALAIVFGVTKFRDYLLGRHFTLQTDHQPLVSLFAETKGVPTMAAARIQRWALTLGAYNYTIKFRKGTLNSNADALSRLPLVKEEKIRHSQQSWYSLRRLFTQAGYLQNA